MINKAILIGNVGKDPEIHAVGDIKCAVVTLATSKKFKDKEGNVKETTQWHRIVLWRNRAELAEKYIKKGSRIYVEGEISYRTNEHEGKKYYITEIVCDVVMFLSSQQTNSAGAMVPEEVPPEVEAEMGF